MRRRYTLSTKLIGIYDSGIGGLTVLRALRQELPHENFIYFADTAHLPYGNKTPQQIVRYTQSILRWMQDIAKVKMVVAACHTSSALALPTLITEFSIPIIGTIEPILETITPHAKIGIIATPATATSLMHERIFKEQGFMGPIVTIGCPDFVPIIEAGLEKGQVDDALLQERAATYLEPFHTQQLNTLIYGCTHYPLIKSIIEPLLPKTVRFIDPAHAIAKQVARKLEQYQLLNPNGFSPSVQYACNTDQTIFQRKVDLVNAQN